MRYYDKSLNDLINGFLLIEIPDCEFPNEKTLEMASHWFGAHSPSIVKIEEPTSRQS